MLDMISIRQLTTPAAVAVSLLLAGCSSPATKAAEAHARFGQAFAAGNYLYARYEIMQAVRFRDDVPEYWIGLARTQVALRQFAGAYQAYSRAHELDRSNREALQNLAEISLLINRLSDADRHTDAILAIDPTDIRARLVKGNLALRRRNYPEAMRWADGLLATYPLEDAPLTLKARALFESGKPAEGIALIERAVPVAGASPQKLDVLLDFYRRTNDPENVDRTLARYVQLMPENPDVKLRYAEQQFRLGKEAGAETIIAQVLQLPNAAGPIADGAAAVMSGAGAKYTSEADIARLAQDAPPAVKAALARAALDLGYNQIAAGMMEPFLGGEMNASTATATGLYASAQQALGNDDRALELAGQVIEFDKANPRALRVRANIAFARGDLNQALSDARILVRDQPGYSGNRILLAKIMAARGNAVLAEQTFRGAYNDLPGNEAVLTEYLAFLAKSDRKDDAVVLARENVSRNPRSAKAWGVLAQTCEAAGDRDCAASARIAQQRTEMIQPAGDRRA